MKLLRNWSAHNKLKDGPSPQEFLLLFPVAMRAYSRVEGNEILPYEEDAFFFNEDTIDITEAQNISRNIYINLRDHLCEEFSPHYNMMLEWYGGKGRSDPMEYDLLLQYAWTEVFKMTDPFGNEENKNKPIIESRYSEFNKNAPFLARIADALYPEYKAKY
jgi:hypothetical protein